MRLVLVGTSHHHAPVEVRERVALPGAEAARLAGELAAEGLEAVCLSTCNRTELYLAADDAGARRGARRRPARRGRRGRGGGALPPPRRRRGAAPLPRRGRARLARAGRGRDPRPGAGCVRARRAGRRARPRLPPGPARGQEGARADRDRREPRLGLVRRRRARAAGLRRPPGPLDPPHRRGQGERAGGAQLHHPRRADRRGREPLGGARGRARRAPRRRGPAARARGRRAGGARTSSSRRRARRASCSARRTSPARSQRRRGRPLFLIDLAVPRDLDPAINDVSGCFLYDIDDLQAVVDETLAGRRREAERAEGIAAAEAERFAEWQASLDVVPAIASLHARAEEIRAAELAKAEARLARLSEAERQRRRGGHRADREQAPAPAHGAHEAGRRDSRRGSLC